MDTQLLHINTVNSVKSLIGQFERKPLMGAEQSYSSELSRSIPKHYVSQYDFHDSKSARNRYHSLHENRVKSNLIEINARGSNSGDHNDTKFHTESEYYYVIDPFPTNSDILGLSSSNYKNGSVFGKSPEAKSKIKSVKSLRRLFEEKKQLNMRASRKYSGTLNTKSKSESNLFTDCAITVAEPLDIVQSETPLLDPKTTNNSLSLSDQNLQRKSFEDKQFQLIEADLQEAEQNIRDMQENFTEKMNNLNDSESIECINIYLTHQDSDTEEDEYGLRILGNQDNVDFVEAFNRFGDELVLTTACVERKSMCFEDALENIISIKLNEEIVTEDGSSTSTQHFLEEESCTDTDHECTETTVKHDLENILNLIPKQEVESSSTNSNSQDSEDEYQPSSASSGIYHTDTTDIMNNEDTDNPSSNDECSFYATTRIKRESEKAVRSETIYDGMQNPIIEKVTNINLAKQLAKEVILQRTDNVSDQTYDSELKNRKDYLIEELITTEKAYLQHLEMVVCHYMPAFSSDKLPTFLRGSKYIFGNIKKIYSMSRKFYRALKKCGTDHEEVAKTFIIFEELFQLYPLYSKNKPTADYFLMGQLRELVSVKERALKDRLGLASHLLTPVQRLGKYILFLEQIQKEIIKLEGVVSGNIYKATEIVRKQMSRGNDFIAIDSIRDSPIDLTSQAGSFLMREKFYVLKPKKYETMLFLFENILIFTTVDAKNPELFIYKDSILLNEMGLTTFEDLPLSFHLKRFSSSKKKEYQEFVVEAKRDKDKKMWTDEIEKRLWEQLIKCKEQQFALQKNKTKRSHTLEVPNKARSKKPGYSSFPEEIRKRRSIFYDEIDS